MTAALLPKWLPWTVLAAIIVWLAVSVAVDEHRERTSRRAEKAANQARALGGRK